MAGDEDDLALLDGIVSSRDGAAEAFDRRFRPYLTSLSRQMRLPVADAADVIQEALAAALVQLRAGRFERRSTLPHWVATIFRNRQRDWLRAEIRRRRLLPLSGQDDVVRESVASLAPSPEALAVSKQRVREALLTLPKRERFMLLLNATRDMPVREIAAVMGMHPKTAEAIVTAAKKQFRAAIRDAK